MDVKYQPVPLMPMATSSQDSGMAVQHPSAPLLPMATSSQNPGMAVQQQSTSLMTAMVTSQGPGTWCTGLCDCFSDMSTCCFGLWCFPFTQCDTASKFGWCALVPTLDYSCVVSYLLRTFIRQSNKIPGSCCDDYCWTIWCCHCSWCQMRREVMIRSQRPATTQMITTQMTNMSQMC